MPALLWFFLIVTICTLVTFTVSYAIGCAIDAIKLRLRCRERLTNLSTWDEYHPEEDQ